jgi:RimJ/RimL family protein N-acetyltransferase
MQPVLVDLPETIETERLILRCPRAGDGAALNAAILESLESLQRFMAWALNPPSVEDSEVYVRGAAATFLTRTSLPLLMIRRGTQEVVGSAGLPRMDWTVPRFEIGYWMRQSYQGQGYMSEAVRALTAFALDTLGAKRVEIHCSHRNVRSQRVAERCGFVLEARLRDFGREPDGELRDELIYARLASAATA